MIDDNTNDLTGAVAACIAKVILWIAPITQEYGTVNPWEGVDGVFGVVDALEDLLLGVLSDLAVVEVVVPLDLEDEGVFDPRSLMRVPPGV